MSDMIMPKFGNGSNLKPPPRPYTEQETVEAMLIAAWREERWDVIQRMVNARSELQLVFTDPLFDSIEGDYTE